MKRLVRNGYWTSLLLGEACIMGNDILLKNGLANHACRYQSRREELKRYLQYVLGYYYLDKINKFELAPAKSKYSVPFKPPKALWFYGEVAIPTYKLVIHTGNLNETYEQIKSAISDLNSRLK